MIPLKGLKVFRGKIEFDSKNMLNQNALLLSNPWFQTLAVFTIIQCFLFKTKLLLKTFIELMCVSYKIRDKFIVWAFDECFSI